MITGKFWQYNQSFGIYRCPSDKNAYKGTPAARSYSMTMNSFIGGRPVGATTAVPGSADTYYIPFFKKDSDITKPTEVFVMIDEDERSINDGFFVTDPPNPSSGKSQMWYDFPANTSYRHISSFVLSFADGHADLCKLVEGQSLQLTATRTAQSGNRDLAKLGRYPSILK